MKEYSRKEFRAWLEKLPQNEPFCVGTRCPISTYMQYSELGLARAQHDDIALVKAIDEKVPVNTGLIPYWQSLTPRQVIALIDELEAA